MSRPSQDPGVYLDWGVPLVPARFLHRPNRFVVHAQLDAEAVSGAEGGPAARTDADARIGVGGARVGGEATDREVVAHLADPGRLRELLIPGARMGLRPEPPSPTRKTRFTAMLVEAPEADAGEWVSVNTTLPNRLVRKALAQDALEEFAGWSLVRHEVPWGSSRLDFLLEAEDGRRLYVEAKSVTLVEEGIALFPDAVTARGTRHLEELMDAVEAGHEAAVLFVLQRPDASRIVAARSIDPVFSETLARARRAGVRILGRRCSVGWDGIRLEEPVPAGAG